MCVGVFTFFSLHMSAQSSRAINEVGTLYMSRMIPSSTTFSPPALVPMATFCWFFPRDTRKGPGSDTVTCEPYIIRMLPSLPQNPR